jgi:hypothetical protein
LPQPATTNNIFSSVQVPCGFANHGVNWRLRNSSEGKFVVMMPLQSLLRLKLFDNHGLTSMAAGVIFIDRSTNR